MAKLFHCTMFHPQEKVKQLKQIPLEISFVKEMKLPRGASNLVPLFPLSAERFNPFDSVPLATMRLKLLMRLKKEDFAEFLAE